MTWEVVVEEATGVGELLTGEAVPGVVFPGPQADRKKRANKKQLIFRDTMGFRLMQGWTTKRGANSARLKNR